MGSRTGPCEWPILGGEECPELVALDGDGEGGPIGRENIERMAVAWLWSWTGKRYGLCDVTVRPARKDGFGTTRQGLAGHPSSGWAGWGWGPALIGGQWFNLGCGVCGDRCTCSELTSIRLPGPVETVEEVTIDGEVLDPAAYRVDNRKWLVRQDGGRWPWCNDLDKMAGEEGTWQVSYKQGIPVPEGGQIAAGVLACEFAKAVTRSGDCRLPERIQTVTREGVTVGILDPFEGIDLGRTGIWLIDSWVTSITSAPARSTVHSPDRRTTRRTTYQGPT